jgi:hypothetical protein
MPDTYQAVLKGNQVEWIDDFPISAFQESEIEVLITVLYNRKIQSDSETGQGERMAECLEKIAETGGVKGISDPLEWQREIRKDRTVYDY